MIWLRWLLALWCVWGLGSAWAGSDAELFAQLGTRHVDVTVRFAGQDVLVFGAVSQPGDVVIKMASPDQSVDMSRRGRYGPFWLTSGKFTIPGTPGLLYVLSTRPVDEIMDSAERDRYGLDLSDVLRGVEPKDVGVAVGAWKSKFIELKKKGHYYLQDGHAVRLVDDRLFSATMALPTKLPLGMYHLHIYLVRDGKVVAQQSRELDVREAGAARWVSDLAYAHSWVFGIGFTLFAMALGLGLGIVLRKGRDD